MSINSTLNKFYAKLTPFYHIIYQDWDKSIQKQARNLNALIRKHFGKNNFSILDFSCGIGTQSLGLAKLGYQVTASDISSNAIDRAREEAEKRKLSITFSVADMRKAFIHHRKQFDLIISCDNSVPHLLSDKDILVALKQFYKCLNPYGGCLISVRDYEKEDLTRQKIESYGIRDEKGIRYLIFQVWEFHDLIYDLSMYFIEDKGGDECVTHVMRTKYYAIGTSKLINLMQEAGFRDVKRIDSKFFQPVLLGAK
jgi:2-polyprenyl-3-methyl-5-hydroxy-6-metoxy-1,4-benzoquinol methylase